MLTNDKQGDVWDEVEGDDKELIRCDKGAKYYVKRLSWNWKPFAVNSVREIAEEDTDKRREKKHRRVDNRTP